MELTINIFIIILAIIAFLILYYRTSGKNQKKGGEKIKLNNLDFEVGSELGMNSQEIQQPGKEEKKKIKKGGEKCRDEYYLKDRYDKTMIRLFARDPNWLYAYWEVNKDEFYQNPPILRLFNEKENDYIDMEIGHDNLDWYIGPIKANNDYKIAVGYKKDGSFFPLAYSKTVKTPADQPSDIIDEHWMTIEELVNLGYRIDIDADSLSIIKNISKRKIAEELNANSYSFVNKIK